MTTEGMKAQSPVDINVRRLSERDIATALVLEYAETRAKGFALLGFYDSDIEFLSGLADRLGVPDNKGFRAKLTKIVRHLVRHNVLYTRMRGTQKEYIGEPAKQMTYILRGGKAELIRTGKTEYTMDPDGEAAFLLRNAYPVRYCRVCEAPLIWDSKRNRWGQCRNGCSQTTAAISSGTELNLTCGSDADGRNVRGSAFRRAVQYDA